MRAHGWLWPALACWVVVFLLFVGPGLFSGRWVDEYRLAVSGQHIVGEVTALQPSEHGGCRYRFSVHERSFQGSREACPAVHVGSRIGVTYLPSEPSVSDIGDPSETFRSDLAFALLAPTVIALLVGATVRRRRARQAVTR